MEFILRLVDKSIAYNIYFNRRFPLPTKTFCNQNFHFPEQFAEIESRDFRAVLIRFHGNPGIENWN